MEPGDVVAKSAQIVCLYLGNAARLFQSNSQVAASAVMLVS